MDVVFFHAAVPELWAKFQTSLNTLLKTAAGGELSDVEALARALIDVRKTTVKQPETLRAFKKAVSDAAHNGTCSESCMHEVVVPFLARLVLDLPRIFLEGLNMLVKSNTCQIYLTRRQCAALIAADFFGALPNTAAQSRHGKLDLPTFSFDFILECQPAKAACLLCYFYQISVASPEFLEQVVSFSRRVETFDPEFWTGLQKPLLAARVIERGAIEQSTGNLQADFANEYLGGGALFGGNVQEEIRFNICTECCVGMLLCEKSEYNEAIFIVGTRQYSTYSGYGGSFAFAGPCPFDQRGEIADGKGRVGPHIVALDALMGPGDMQYQEGLILREVFKAYIACLGDLAEGEGPRQIAFATGNWGCGMFGGDPMLKSLIQWLAASAADRELEYFPFGDDRVADLPRIIEAIQASNARCCDLYAYLQGHTRGQVFDRIYETATRCRDDKTCTETGAR